MTRKLGGLRLGVLGGTTGIVVAVGMVFGASGITHADPSTDASATPTTTTAPAPAPATTAAPAAGPVTTPSIVATSAPKPTVAVEGGAAATAATTGTTAAGATSGDVLDQLADEYATGAGGGQLSNLLKVALKLKAMGFKPSKQYNEELAAAMKARPNQLPLIGALKDTIAYQQKLKAQMDVLSNAQAKQGAAMGAGAAPGPSNGYGAGPVSVVATPPAAPPPTP